eukprot:m.269365 g.269365  ORF g.269365 m.269365 type:complete len:1204 (+) comp19302_c0_seq2:210-3821(+)
MAVWQGGLNGVAEDAIVVSSEDDDDDDLPISAVVTPLATATARARAGPSCNPAQHAPPRPVTKSLKRGQRIKDPKQSNAQQKRPRPNEEPVAQNKAAASDNKPGDRHRSRIRKENPPAAAETDGLAANAAEAAAAKVEATLMDRLLDYQRAGVEFALQHNGRCLLADEMGLGKTLQAITAMFHFRKAWPLLIVAPASVRGCWMDELEKWLPSIDPAEFHLVRSGQDTVPIGKAKISLVTYGLLNQPKLLECISKQRFACVILDESHYIKGRNTKRTKALVPIVQQATHAMLLTGTPALGRPEELFCQLDALCPKKFGSFTDFTKRYCDAHRDHFGRWNTKGSSNLPELHQRLSSTVMIRRLKKDVLKQLPAKRRQRIAVDVTKDDLEAIQTTLQTISPNSLEVGLFERNKTMVELYHKTGQAKISAVQKYVENLCRGGHKFLVFAYHRKVIQALEQTVSATKTDYMLIDGTTPTQERRDGVNRFQTDDRCRVAILSVSAAGQGITLTAASTVVFAELHWTPGIIEQAEDRAHRIGQQNSVNVHFLVAPGTLDDVLYRMLNSKLANVSRALDGHRTGMQVGRTKSTDQVELEPPTKAEWTCSDCDENPCLCQDSPQSLPATDLRAWFCDGFVPPNQANAAEDDTQPWTCSRCTYHNQPDGISGTTVIGSAMCQMCGAERQQKRKGQRHGSSTPALSAPVKDSKQPSPFLFYVSANTGRVWLYDKQETPLHVNFHVCEFDRELLSSLSAPFCDDVAHQSVVSFLRQWSAIKAVDQRALSSRLIPSVRAGLDEVKRQRSAKAQSTVRFSKVPRGLTTPGSASTETEKVEPGTSSLFAMWTKSAETPKQDPLACLSKEDVIDEFSSESDEEGNCTSVGNKTKQRRRQSDAGSNEQGSDAKLGGKGGSSRRRNHTSGRGLDSEDDGGGGAGGAAPDASFHQRPAGTKRRRESSSSAGLVSGPSARTPSAAERWPAAQQKASTNGNGSSDGGSSSKHEKPGGTDGPEAGMCRFCRQPLAPFPWVQPATTPGSPTKQAQAPTVVKNPTKSAAKGTKGQQRATAPSFCSHECWEQYSVQAGVGVRRRLLELEKGICQLCGLDAHTLYKRVKALPTVALRLEHLRSTRKFRKWPPQRLQKLAESPKEGLFWQGDHIVPVSEGGGECQLDNYRTLCTPCHEGETAKLAPARKIRQMQQAAQGTKDIRSWFGQS